MARFSAHRNRAVLCAALALAVIASVEAVRLAHPPPLHARPVRVAAVPPTVNPIVAENRLRGTTAWRIGRYAGRSLEGFASATSAAPGQRVTVYVSTTYPTFSAVLYRMGWYGGAGGRAISTLGPFPGRVQPPATVDAKTRMVEAHWSPSFAMSIASTWTTGVYLVRLTAPDGAAAYVPFTVREGTHRAPLLFQSSVTTWQAYNDWGGHSLYAGVTGRGGRSAGQRSAVVSFDRPYATGAGAGDFFYMEESLLQWLEEQGYDLGYAASIDTHEDPTLLAGRRAFLSMGHDEYWSTAMRGSVERAVASGVNLAFFGANAMYRHIRLEPSPLGADRREVNYRSAAADPVTRADAAESTVQWRDTPVRRPEDAVLGAMYECNPVHADAVVYDPLPILFAGTGLRSGDRVKGLIGREYDRVFRRAPASRQTWVLFRSPVHCGGIRSVADTVLTRFPSGALVFDASSQGFGCAFGGCATTPLDQGVQRLVRNLLDVYLGRVVFPLDVPARSFAISRAHYDVTRRTEERPQPTSSVREPPTPVPPRRPR